MQTEMMTINMGPQHPSTHGVLRLEVELEGEVINKVTPHIGYLHRCFEKHTEAMTYPQVLPYVDRMDYLAAMNNELGYVLTVEKMAGIEVPERVSYLRVIVSELQRVASHLVGLGTYGLDIGSFTPFLYCFREREKIVHLFELISGARLLYNYIRIGGVANDLHPDFARLTKEYIKGIRKTVEDLNMLLTDNKIFIERTANVGILLKQKAIDYGVTGPNLRASGVTRDLRKQKPYSLYERFDFDIPVGKGSVGSVGDSWDRFYVRILEIEESLRIVEQALEQLPEGDVKKSIPRKVKLLAGSYYHSVENPRGELGYFIVSDGSDKPYRIKVRAPSFVNLSVFPELCEGHLVADLITILGSIDIVLGEVDR